MIHRKTDLLQKKYLARSFSNAGINKTFGKSVNIVLVFINGRQIEKIEGKEHRIDAGMLSWSFVVNGKQNRKRNQSINAIRIAHMGETSVRANSNTCK